MSMDPPKTPPAWFAHVERRQEAQHRRLNAIESRVGANSLATGQQVGELASLVLEVRETLSAVKEAIADLHAKLGGQR